MASDQDHAEARDHARTTGHRVIETFGGWACENCDEPELAAARAATTPEECR